MAMVLRRMAGVVVAGLVVSSCVTGTWTGDPEAPSVAVVGDSLVFQSERSSLSGTETWITDALVAEGRSAWVTGWIGLTVATAYPAVWNEPSRQGITPDVLVIALGTNDMRIDTETGLPRTTPEAARSLVRSWLAEVPDACVRLIGPSESIVGWGLDVTAPAWNEMLTEEAALHPNAAYVPWNPPLEWTQNGANPHMTTAGRSAYRDLIVSEVAGCIG